MLTKDKSKEMSKRSFLLANGTCVAIYKSYINKYNKLYIIHIHIIMERHQGKSRESE